MIIDELLDKPDHSVSRLLIEIITILNAADEKLNALDDKMGILTNRIDNLTDKTDCQQRALANVRGALANSSGIVDKIQRRIYDFDHEGATRRRERRWSFE
jgi:hypothetical protein